MGKVEIVADLFYCTEQGRGTVASTVCSGGFTDFVGVSRRPASKGKGDLMLDAGFAEGVPVAMSE